MVYSWGSGSSANQRVNLKGGKIDCPIANSTSQEKGLDEVQVVGKVSPLLVSVIPSRLTFGQHVDVATTITKYTSRHKIYTYASKNNDTSSHRHTYTHSICNSTIKLLEN